jgi:hypothetical protein
MTAGDPWQKQLWDMGQRIGMRIADLLADKRDAGFVVAEREMRDLVRKLGLKPEDAVVDLQMEVIRDTVRKIDLGGSPQGGNA